MARERRKEEEYLEATEPVGVVILNDIVYLLEDLSEIILDIAKLQRKRPDEVQKVLAASKEGPEALAGLIPGEIAQAAQMAVMQLIGTVMQVQMEVAQTQGTAVSVGGMEVDPEELTPDQLEAIGKAVQEQSDAVGKTIADFEANLLKEKK